MERESFKEYSKGVIVEKEELYAMKSCFEELHTLLSMAAGRYFFRTEQAERNEFLSGRGTLR